MLSENSAEGPKSGFEMLVLTFDIGVVVSLAVVGLVFEEDAVMWSAFCDEGLDLLLIHGTLEEPEYQHRRLHWSS